MWKKLLWIACSLGISSASYANVIILGTRVVYPANQKNVTVQLTNESDTPALVQSWIDNGDLNASPDQIKTPFVITPPVTRVESKRGQSLRITYTGEALPTDKESIFYFNVLDVPPKPKTKGGNQNYLQIAIRSRLKLFFRPTGLPYPVHEAYDKVTWRVDTSAGKPLLVVHNPSPYYITYSQITLEQGSQKVEVNQPDMVAPMSEASFPLPSNAIRSGSIKWAIINDFGGKQTGSSPLP
ncbi:fimbria/pilus periplasmic chaperone [Pelistega europaea]|uniref:Fimbria/pilus periplasmic chaperone n=1 Tax=Pelistega europaea TaxID=106147 RepID=A0A7Y4LBC9_9BURK|nr:fimbria/pilus periplasmic chaperone [Pelistega europaea]NOL49181.1 fimbria/pilus periplasmic chaperone [Pelistega europaea]